jgi:hypothetical protein
MRFVIKGPFKENIYTLMRRAGYPALPSSKRQRKQEAELEFARPLRGYPRFHLFIKTQNDSLICNLHLDQKKPIYQGAIAHGGEYNSKIVKKEAERIKRILK